MTDAELLETGELCEALLVNHNFKSIVVQYELSIAADMLATKPGDKARREELYASLWGARGLLEFMQLNVNAAATIKTPKNPDQDPGTTDYHVEPIYDDEGFPVHNNENDY
jgi:hypothetical protein